MTTSPVDERVPTVQSVVQLFEQLRRRGYEEAELHRVRAGYTSAMRLFAGRVHTSGKPYIAHCVGAASALAGCDAPADVVVAGLLHGAYRWGDFGPWRVVMPLERARLRREVGVRVEEYVHGFHSLPWSVDAIRRLPDRLPGLDPIARAAVLMRLASDLDNIRDRSLGYCVDAERRLASLPAKGPLLIRLAEEIGSPRLAQALAAAVGEATDEVAAELRWPHPPGALFAPESSRRRAAAAVGQACGDLLQRLRRAVGG